MEYGAAFVLPTEPQCAEGRGGTDFLPMRALAAAAPLACGKKDRPAGNELRVRRGDALYLSF